MPAMKPDQATEGAHDHAPKPSSRAAISEVAEDTGVKKSESAPFDKGTLGTGRGVRGAGGGHHPGDGDGCVENSYRS